MPGERNHTDDEADKCKDGEDIVWVSHGEGGREELQLGFMNENPVPLLVRDLVYPLWHQSLEMLKDQAESGHFLQSRYGIPLHDIC